MRYLSSINLKWKVPGFVVSLCFMVAIAISLSSYLQFRKTILHEEADRFYEYLHGEAGLLENWFEGTASDVELMGVNPTVIEAVQGFASAWDSLGENRERQLQQHYIAQNVYPTGEKHRLDAAEDGSFYSKMHALYHPYLRTVLETNAYYDMFLFDADGNLIYSVYKESDFATNFNTGAFAKSGLGDAFRRARRSSHSEVHFVDFTPYAPSAGAAAAFMSTPIFNAAGDLIGVYAVQLPIGVIQALLDRSAEGADMDHVYLVGDDGLLRSEVVMAESTFKVLDPVEGEFAKASIEDSSEHVSFNSLDSHGNSVVSAAAPVHIMGASWRTIAEKSRAAVLGPLTQMRDMMLIGSAVALVLLSALGWMFSRSITKPASDLEQNLRRIAAEDFDFDIDGTDRGDEFGNSARALADLKASLEAAREMDEEVRRKSHEQQEVVEKLTTGLRELSTGNLACKLKEPLAREFEPLRENFNTSLDTLNELIVEVIESCKSITSQSNEISKSADNLSNRTENQAATLEETAAALDQLTDGVKQAAQSAKEVEEIVADARGSAETGKKVVDDAVAAMEEIEESSNQISEIISVIDDIAFQTNLLALNAGVEAGRAGDAGKGFAVVASEVGSLAQRSSDAAKAIKKLISNSARQVSKGVKNVSDTGEAISAIVERVSHISELMRETASSASEQSHSLDEINIGVNQLDQVTQQNAAMVEQSTEASHELRKKSQSLTDIVSQFKTQGAQGLKTSKRKAPVALAQSSPTEEALDQAMYEEMDDSDGPLKIANAANDGVWQNF